MRHRWPLASLTFILAFAACMPASLLGPGPAENHQAPRATGLKRITAAIMSGEPAILRASAIGEFGGGRAGIDSLEDLVHAGASRTDDTEALRPVLAEAVPSIENSLWRVLPDGTMETSWTLKNGVHWHDGAPVTAQDLLFTLTVCMDQQLEGFCASHVGFDVIASATARDDRTVTVAWKQPFIEADALFTTQFAMPIPSHLLERAYRESGRGMTELRYWNREFVGAGPFQVRDWVDASHIVLRAFDGYVLGRPKIDEIVVRFIEDPNAIVANMLSGEIDVNLGRGISLDQAIQIRDVWRDGRLHVGPVNWIVAHPQFIDPRPALLLDVRFRKALLYGLNRQEMADALLAGLSPVAHAYFDTSLPQYRELDPFVVKYDFDSRRAVQLIESIGSARGADGTFRDPSGQRLSVETRITGTQDILLQAQLSMADYWQRIGVGVEPMVIQPQRMRDREYRATRPGFEMSQISAGVKGLRRAHSRATPLPENNFTASGNVSRYVNPEFDALLDRFFSTIPIRERMQVLGQILHHTSDQITILPLFQGAQPLMASNRILGIGPRKAGEGTDAWNAHLWDVAT